MTAGRCPGAAALIVGVGGRKTGAEQKIAEWVSVVGRVDVGRKLDKNWTAVGQKSNQIPLKMRILGKVLARVMDVV